MVHVPHVPQGVSCEESRAAMMQVPLPRAKRLSQLSLEASGVGKRARTGREVEVGLSARRKELQCSPATRGERAQHTRQHGPRLVELQTQSPPAKVQGEAAQAGEPVGLEDMGSEAPYWCKRGRRTRGYRRAEAHGTGSAG